MPTNFNAKKRRGRRRERPASERAYRFPGGSAFSDDARLSDPVFVLCALKQFPHIVAPLIAVTTPPYICCRPRLEGSWALVMLAYLLWGIVEYRTFRDTWASSELWEEAGFQPGDVPGKSLVHLRLTELELYSDASGRRPAHQAGAPPRTAHRPPRPPGWLVFHHQRGPAPPLPRQG